jgi:flavin-dependent dehydrogenase
MIQTTPAVARPQPEVDSEYDVIVIGAGPAGTTVAALTAEYGHKVLVLDRSMFPRFHVGESLIPECYGPLKRLGLLDRLRESAFPKKYSVQFYSDGDKASAPFYFHMHNDHECSQTWQVIRSEFDDMLLDKAIENGATCHTAAHVMDVLFEGDQAIGVKVKLTNGPNKETREIRSRIVVDATGQSAFIASRLGLKDTDPRLKKGTVWTYWKGAKRDTGKDEGATLILQTPGKKSWFWYIPLPNDVVSIGCTGSMPYMFNKDRGDAASVYDAELARCPELQTRLKNAQRCTDHFTTKDYSYYSTQAAGPGWLLVGDAIGFIDPVYSSGVFLALKSGEYAADAIHDSIERNDLSAARLSTWQRTYREGVEHFRKLVYAFYAPEFSFGQFLKQHPEYHGHLVDVLIGDVFKPGIGKMFEAMGNIVPPPDVHEDQPQMEPTAKQPSL